jgi:hypothetical protein
MPEPYFFFRPILAADRSWAALDWQSGALFTGDGADLERCFTEAAAAPLARLLPMVVPLNPECIEQSTFVDGFDASQVVFVLPAATLENTQTLARCKQLRSQGYHFGLHIKHADLLRQVPVAAFDFLWLDAAFARQDLTVIDLNYANDAGFRKIATKVGSHEMFGWLTEKKFDWCDSAQSSCRP